MFKTKTKTLHLKTKTFLWCRLRLTEKNFFFIFGRKRKCRWKRNSVCGRKRNENEHSFSAEKRKRKSPDNISGFFFFFIHSVTKSALMRRQYLIQFRLFAGGPCWRNSTFLMYSISYRYLCGIFLDDISTREPAVCFPGLLLPSESIFHNLCTALYWRLCGLTNSPHC